MGDPEEQEYHNPKESTPCDLTNHRGRYLGPRTQREWEQCDWVAGKDSVAHSGLNVVAADGLGA